MPIGPYIATRAARAGFSLLELVIVLAIVATLATIAAPRYGASLAAYRVESAARRIVADLALARSMARTENRRVIVKFDTKDDKDRRRCDNRPVHQIRRRARRPLVVFARPGGCSAGAGGVARQSSGRRRR